MIREPHVSTPSRDPVFASFAPFRGSVPQDFIVDFIGCRIRNDFLSQDCRQNRTSDAVETTWPPFDEEYFEWLDLLDAVAAADSSFTMLELGAGFGRWAVRGALAARSLGIATIRLGVVEPEPVHLEYLRLFLADNGIPEDVVDVYPGTISEDAGTVLFQVKKHVQSTQDHPRDWYGQAKTPENWSPGAVAQGAYYGRDLFVFPNGEGAIEVQQFAAAKLIRSYPSIDLIDLDVQGEEFNVLYGAIEVLNASTKRLHIGTHGAQIESNLREMLTANRWQCLRDYACDETVETPVGSVYFMDGIQTWINPRLVNIR